MTQHSRSVRLYICRQFIDMRVGDNRVNHDRKAVQHATVHVSPQHVPEAG